jgi:excisionase family DNA binding protein
MTQPSRRQAHEPPGPRGPHASEQSPDLPVDRLAYSIKEAAEATGLSRDLLYDEMRAGRLAYLKIGRRRIITRQQLQSFLARGPGRE